MVFLNSYIENILNYDLINKFFFNSVKKIPKIKKIYLIFTCGNSFLKDLSASLIALEIISSQKSTFTYLKTSKVLLKLKKGSPVGCAVILRKKKMILFLTELLVFIFPKFLHNIKLASLKKKKSFSFNIKNPLLFYELEKKYQFFNKLKGLNITIVTNSKNKKELLALLTFLKFIYSKRNSIW